jgi:ferredoxin, 2Fe-2S
MRPGVAAAVNPLASDRFRTNMTKITFVDPNGKSQDVDAPLGKSVLDIAQANGFDVEGACEGSLACSTCHVIIDPAWYDKLKPAQEEEEDMLDLAYGLTRTSRLCCQILMTEELDGLVVNLPAETHNLMI